jgi:WD40 repeat protein
VTRLAFLAGQLFLCLERASGAAPVAALAFSPDGATLAVAAGKTLTLRSPRDGSPLRTLAAGLARITALAFHPGGGVLAVMGGEPGESGAVAILDIQGGEVVARLEDHVDLVTAGGYSPDGSLLVVSSADGSATVYRLTERGRAARKAFRLEGHAGAVLAAALSPDGRLIITAGADRSVKVWSAASGALLRSMNQHGEAVHVVAFRPPGSAEVPGMLSLATGSDDRTVRVWQPETGRMVRIVRQHQGPALAVVYARDGASLFTAGTEGIIRRFDAGSDRLLGQWTASGDWIHALALSPDGRRLATGDAAGELKLWEVAGDELRPALSEEKK